MREVMGDLRALLGNNRHPTGRAATFARESRNDLRDMHDLFIPVHCINEVGV
jgi:hypothetical protein